MDLRKKEKITFWFNTVIELFIIAVLPLILIVIWVNQAKQKHLNILSDLLWQLITYTKVPIPIAIIIVMAVWLPISRILVKIARFLIRHTLEKWL